MSIISDVLQDSQHLVVKVDGIFNYEVRDEFLGSYQSHVDTSVLEMSVDLTEVTYIDSAAFGMLLLLKDKATEKEIDLKVVMINENIKTVFEHMNLHELFNVKVSRKAS